MVATFALSSPLSARAEAVALKGPEVSLTASYGEGSAAAEKYRFITGTASDMHVLSVPGSLGYPPAFTPPAMRRFEVTGGGWGPGRARCTSSFMR